MAKKNKNKKGLLKSMTPVKKLGALALSGLIVAGGLGMVRSAVKVGENNRELDNLDVRQAQLLVDIKADDNYMDWYENRVNTCKDALSKDIITEQQYNDNIRKFSNDEYILNNISTIDYINQKYAIEKESIDAETVSANKAKSSASVVGAGNAVLTGVAGAGLMAMLSAHARKREQEAKLRMEQDEEIAM